MFFNAVLTGMSRVLSAKLINYFKLDGMRGK